MAEQNHYEVLGISKTATENEIKQAYKRLAKKYHPDLNQGNKEAGEMFVKVNEANEVLSNPEKRKRYDMENSPQRAGGAGFGGMGGMGSNIFNDIFSNMFSSFGGGAGTAERRQSAAPATVKVAVPITFVESLKGVVKKITVPKMDVCGNCQGSGAKPGTPTGVCPKCHGSGRIQFYQQTPLGTSVVTSVCDKCQGKGKIIVDPCPKCYGIGLVKVNSPVDITIPKGVNNGQSFVIKGGGNATANKGVPKGDLVIMIEVAPHKYLKRQGLDLFMEYPISFTVALLGGKVGIPTLDGVVQYDIPEATQNGQTLKVKGKGINSKQGVGDLYLKINIVMPKLSRSEKEALEKIQASIQPSEYKKIKVFEQEMAELTK